MIDERWQPVGEDEAPHRPIRPAEPKKECLESPWFLVGGIVAGCLAGFAAAIAIAKKAMKR